MTLTVAKGDGRRLNTQEKDAAKTRTWQGNVKEKGTGRKGKGRKEGMKRRGRKRRGEKGKGKGEGGRKGSFVECACGTLCLACPVVLSEPLLTNALPDQLVDRSNDGVFVSVERHVFVCNVLSLALDSSCNTLHPQQRRPACVLFLLGRASAPRRSPRVPRWTLGASH